MNNNAFVMLLLFATLLFNPQIFSQGNNEEFVDNLVSAERLNLNEISTTEKFAVVLDGIEIKLRKRNVKKTRKTNEAIVTNTSLNRVSDFSNLLRQFNQKNRITYPFEINIVDVSVVDAKCPEICIVVDSNVVYKFRLLSKHSYLYAAVQESNKRLNQYLLDNKQLYVSD